MSTDKPVPVVDPDSAPYWEGAKEGRLMVQRCGKTGQHFLYSRVLTPGVDDSKVEWIQAKGTGTIYSFTVARRPAGPAFQDDVPYVIASIDLDEGARIMTNVVTKDPDSIRIGQKVRVRFDKHSDDVTVPKFEVVS